MTNEFDTAKIVGNIYDNVFTVKHCQFKLEIIKTLMEKELSSCLTKYSKNHKIKKIDLKNCCINIYGELSFRTLKKNKPLWFKKIIKITNFYIKKYHISIKKILFTHNNKIEIKIENSESIWGKIRYEEILKARDANAAKCQLGQLEEAFKDTGLKCKGKEMKVGDVIQFDK